MEKLSEYIPFLIIIVWGIISLVKKTKQPAEKASFPEEVFPKIPQLPPLIYEDSVPPKKIVTPSASKISVSEKNRHIAYENSVEIQGIDEFSGINIDFSESEEVKKAIIYSEIFNRKDF